MSYQVLARKWRPKTFSQLVGQEHVSQALINGLDQNRLHHAFLFTGTRGVGKTTIARIMAKCLNCETGVSSTPCGECSSCTDIDDGRFVDMLEIDAASRTKVDDTRELLDSVQYMPSRGRYKVYIIDEVHMLSNSSFNALLKTLEEPPPHVKFVLATTDPEKIPVTILSRCLRFNLRRLLPDQIGAYLKLIVKTEGIEADAGALTSLAQAADGSMRDGLSLLDQAISFGAGRLVKADVENMLGLVDYQHITTMVRALASEDAQGLLAVVEELVAQSRDLKSVLVNLAEALHRINLVQCVPGYRDSERSDWEAIADLAELLSAQDAQLFYQIAIKGRDELGLAPDPRTGLEMTLLRMLAFRPASADMAPPGPGPARTRKRPSAVEERKPQPANGSTEPIEPELFSSPCAVPSREAPQDLLASDEEPPDNQPEAPSLSSEDEWVALQRHLEISGQARELARNVQLKARSEDCWDFIIATSLRHLGSENCVSRLSQAISNRMGHTVRITLIDSEGKNIISAAALDEQRNRHSMSEAEKAINDDPTVKALKEQFGARIVEDSIQPLQ